MLSRIRAVSLWGFGLLQIIPGVCQVLVCGKTSAVTDGIFFNQLVIFVKQTIYSTYDGCISGTERAVHIIRLDQGQLPIFTGVDNRLTAVNGGNFIRRDGDRIYRIIIDIGVIFWTKFFDIQSLTAAQGIGTIRIDTIGGNTVTAGGHLPQFVCALLICVHAENNTGDWIPVLICLIGT